MAETTPAKKTAASPRAKTPATDGPLTVGTGESVWDRLARPFDADEIEKLPKILRRDDQDKGRCDGDRYSADGHYCGGWHARAMHLDYVGHAGITMRLNEVVTPEGWSWEPMALDSDGLPIMSGEFWIKLTVNGVTKYGVGDDFGRSSKQAIGDALRNAAMRFGIATYLWSKSEASLALKRATDDVEPAEENAPTRRHEPRAPTLGEALGADVAALPGDVLAMVQQDWPYAPRPPSDLTDEEAVLARQFVDSIVADVRAGKASAQPDPWATPADPT